MSLTKVTYSMISGAPVNVLDFGAVGNGVTNSTVAIQAAVDFLSNGGTIYFPPGVYVITSTINVNKSGIRLIGAGRDGTHDFTPLVPNYDNTAKTTSILWNGAVGGTMIKIEPLISDPAGVSGNALLNMNLLSSEFPHTNAAAIGLSLVAATSGEYDFFGLECSTAALYMSARNVNPATAESSTRFNTIRYLGSRNYTTSGGGLKADGINLVGNTYNNLFQMVEIAHQNGVGMDLYSCDNNIFTQTRINRAAGGTGVGVYLRSSATSDTTARANLFTLLSPGGGGVVSDNTLTYPAYENKIQFYNPDENGAPLTPFVMLGSSLFYNTTKQSGASYFKAIINPSQTFSATSAWTKVTFTQSVDPDDIFDSPNNRLKPIYPGVYNLAICLTLTPASNIAGEIIQVRVIDNNGTAIGRSNVQFQTGTSSITLSLNVQVNIALGNYVQVEIFKTVAVNLTIESATSDGTFWYGSRAA